MSRKTVMSVALVFASGLVLSAAGVAVASSSRPETVSVTTVHEARVGEVASGQSSLVEAGDETVEPICVVGDAAVPAGDETEELVAPDDVTPVASTDEEPVDPSECSVEATELVEGEVSTAVPAQAPLGNG